MRAYVKARCSRWNPRDMISLSDYKASNKSLSSSLSSLFVPLSLQTQLYLYSGATEDNDTIPPISNRSLTLVSKSTKNDLLFLKSLYAARGQGRFFQLYWKAFIKEVH